MQNHNDSIRSECKIKSSDIALKYINRESQRRKNFKKLVKNNKKGKTLSNIRIHVQTNTE